MKALQKNKSTQSSCSVFDEGIEKAKKTIFELELMKTVDRFLDGDGNSDNSLLSFQNQSL